MAHRAVFVDRDGVINRLVPDPVSGRPESPLAVDDVELIEGAVGALRRLALGGWRLIGVSNQPAAAKGLVPLSRIQAVQAAILGRLQDAGVTFDDFRLCLHHPDGVVPELTRLCECRKPAPGMLLAAASGERLDLSGSWMIGDTDADVAAGRAAGCRTILVEHPASRHKRSGATVADAVVGDLTAAAELILRAGE